jgi:hypothetical protein
VAPFLREIQPRAMRCQLEYMSTLCLLLEGMVSSQKGPVQVQDAVIRLDTISKYPLPSEAVAARRMPRCS